ncbi:hypothetical protein CYLTODRAFT_424220 [Cylindrobasidium torrendii FP15055 ss-10]|uniref:Uncharacterized protein n=1 Tax=Cylindrobasidium torrendii FP15055 ss-10 TaxID=1314674 RepID=A0A0D7B4U9_9AGAR|nr:hypothetical protein CYLTODRAFT_424220 [Cylindrobasidium torrendii FP15055 ss-10]
MSETYGIDYPAGFLDSLPTVAAPSTATAPPIPVLSAAQLAELHFKHIVGHAPDHVVFPFFHGLEGNNPAQNHFFQSQDDVPRYRGMMYVVCDDDVDIVSPSPEDTDDDTDDLESSDELDEMDMDMDIELEMNREMDDDGVAVHEEDDGMEIVGLGPHSSKQEKEEHMHPVIMKPPPLLNPPMYSNHGKTRSRTPPLLTSTFQPCDLIQPSMSSTDPLDWEFVPLVVPDGISLRNFGIQVSVLVTVSDIVIYSPTSDGAKSSANALKLAERFRRAISKKKQQRLEKLRARARAPNATDDELAAQLLDYNVFVLDSSHDELASPDCPLKHVVRRCAAARAPSVSEASSLSDEVYNTVNFASREKEEMRDLTAASELLRIERPPTTPPTIPETADSISSSTAPAGQIFLGNSNDVPLPSGGDGVEFDYDYGTVPENESRLPTNPSGYDMCIECHDLAPFPSPAHLRAVDDKLNGLETRWRERVAKESGGSPSSSDLPPRPRPHANSIIHLPFPASPTNTASIKTVIRFLDGWLSPPALPTPADKGKEANAKRRDETGRRWSLLSSTPSFPLFNLGNNPVSPSSAASSRIRSFTSPVPPPFSTAEPSSPQHSRPLRVLIYSSDGYTESSVLALCLLISLKNLSLPEAYLELQVSKQRSFFVYSADLGLLRRWEAEERGKDKDRGVRGSKYFAHRRDNQSISEGHGPMGAGGMGASWHETGNNFGESSSVPKDLALPDAPRTRMGRPRASTLPATSMLGWDHQTWFDDPRFDGSFPSRVLPFLYLGNLNHASNAYMLHALGITHVVSVGECALNPPPNAQHDQAGCEPSTMTTHYMKSPPTVPPRPNKQGSLWIEEKAGRIKVLDIQGVSDDGIDTLEPQLEPICRWMDEAREEGGNVLVHCRVGVSRSATVTIAYVMKHLRISLVEAYLIVRSRRLSVLIQPNMRLLYNLCGWEVKLAKQRAGDDEERLKEELAKSVSWPFLAKEVHKLNEKYLR